MTEIEPVIIGTAGRIDHGKTLLVKASAGIRFFETSGYEKLIEFIEVPSLEKFINTMVAGASNIWQNIPVSRMPNCGISQAFQKICDCDFGVF